MHSTHNLIQTNGIFGHTLKISVNVQMPVDACVRNAFYFYHPICSLKRYKMLNSRSAYVITTYETHNESNEQKNDSSNSKTPTNPKDNNRFMKMK